MTKIIKKNTSRNENDFPNGIKEDIALLGKIIAKKSKESARRFSAWTDREKNNSEDETVYQAEKTS